MRCASGKLKKRIISGYLHKQEYRKTIAKCPKNEYVNTELRVTSTPTNADTNKEKVFFFNTMA